jgi:hypothetical protein
MWPRPSRFASRVLLQYVLAGLLLLGSAAASFACQVCLEAARELLSIGGQLDLADRIVLAAPVAGGKQFRIIEVVKGKDPVGDIITDPVTGADAAAPAGLDPWLLVSDGIAARWTSLGSIGARYGDWLRRLVSFDSSDAGWRQRIAFVLPYLENPDPLVAEIAVGEVARAPYETLDVAKSHLDPDIVESWLDDPKLVSRYTPYTLLLGFAGGSAEAARLDQRIDAARQAHSSTNLAAMLTADLELRGPPRVAWVVETYFADRGRSMPEIEAALLALDVHGDANCAVSRERVIQAYRLFIRMRPPMAGFVAPQLAEWSYWDAAAEYAALLASNAIPDPASEFAIAIYLQRAASAKAAEQ